jgi:ribosomal-protein-alanine N-acetyltransferase
VPSQSTERLTLKTLNTIELKLCLTAPSRLADAAIGVPLVADGLISPDVKRAFQMKYRRLETVKPAAHSWYTYWLVILRDDSVGIGLAGFKGEPDATGEVEIGYGIAAAYHNQGYMTEAAAALIGWAFTDSTCRAIVTRKTRKSNAASLRVQHKLGFRIYHESTDYYDLRLLRPDSASD